MMKWDKNTMKVLVNIFNKCWYLQELRLQNHVLIVKIDKFAVSNL